MSLSHWSSLDRHICIVSYADTIVSMQYLYDIFTVLYHSMATAFILYVPPTNFTFEYVTWPHEAKTYVNSILNEVFYILRLKEICGLLTKC